MIKYFDILVTNSGTNNIGAFFGYDNGSFADQITFSTGANSHPTKLNCADFNGDHFLDIFVFNKNLKQFGILFGFNNGSFILTKTYSLENDSNPESFTIEDINNDKQLDLIVANSKSNRIDIFLGYGNGNLTFDRSYSTGINSQPIFVVINDSNNDNQSDIIVMNFQGKNIQIFLRNDENTLSHGFTYSTEVASGPSYVAVGDLKNDRYLVVVVANYATNNISIFLGDGDGRFSSQQTYSTGRNSQPNSVAIGDLNSDNRLDIVVFNCNNGNIGVFLGYGNGSFASQKTYSIGISSHPQMLLIYDFNNDTYLDVTVISTYSPSLSIFLNNGNGTLQTE
ncbi:unnamed protein product [Adineta ricciae]|uniref:VCBS repeat-containing protein n=1 Tax=Adineta ricciae TaxID=249248 RepID=A0A816FU33_ADIRI|nr:unnamed protein product [Adineta ricciae]CAF1666203.1 unnamed protein product [Adineta ricciae]